MKKILFIIFFLLSVAPVRAQTFIAIKSGYDVLNSGSEFVISTPYPGPGASFINDGSFTDTTAPDSFIVYGDYNFSGAGITLMNNFVISQGASTINAPITVYDTVSVGSGNTLNASNNIYLLARGWLIDNGVLNGIFVHGLVTKASVTTSAICYSTNLSVNMSGANAMYQWQSSPDSVTWTNVAGATGAVYTAWVSSNSIYYRCYLTTSNTAFAQDSKAVKLIITSPVPGPLTGNTHICGTSTVTLTDTATGGAWSSTAHVSVDGSGNVTGVSVGTATITYTLNNCVVDTTVTVYAIPGMTAVADQALCNAVNTVKDTFESALSGATYSWTNSNSGIGIASAGSGNTIPSFTVTNSGSVTDTGVIIVTPSANGCAGMADTSMIIVYPTPNVAATANKTLCNGAAGSFNFTGSVGNTSFLWTNSDPAIGIATNGTDSSGIFIAANTTPNPQAGTIIARPTANGCLGRADTFTITVNPTPVLSSTLTPPAVCGNAPFNYTGTSLTSGTTYAWTMQPSTGISATATSGIVNAINDVFVNSSANPIAVTFVYTLTASGCAHTEDIAVIVNPLPVAPVIATYVSEVCEKTINQNFGVDRLPPPGGKYEWSATNASVLAVGITGQYSIINFNEPANAVVTVALKMDSTECSSSSSQNVTVGSATAAQPFVDYSFGEFICLENNVTSYQWGYDDRLILDSTLLPGQINQNYAISNPDIANKFYWVITRQNGCLMKSYYNGESPNGVAIVSSETDVKVYPNPTSELIKIDINTTIRGNITVELSDMLGQIINERQAVNNKAAFNVADLASGIYIIACYRDGIQIATAKVIKN